LPAPLPTKPLFSFRSPSPVLTQSVFPEAPRGVRPVCKIALPRQSVLRGANREAKNTGICRLFGRSGDFTKGCQPVLLLDHIICIPKGTEGPGLVRKATGRGAHIRIIPAREGAPPFAACGDAKRPQRHRRGLPVVDRCLWGRSRLWMNL
jgi:hypothetical protein